MSVIGAMYTAISGLNAQAAAFSNIADNTANSQTVGFKRVDTAFQDILTQSSPSQNEPGSVIAMPEYQNSLQGTIQQTDNPLNLAVSGQGFFAVSETNGTTTTNQPTFSAQQYYTRAGDFSMNDNGYLVNSAGQYLNGWTVNPVTNVVAQNALVPLQVDQSSYAPQATTSVQLSASLPASAPQTTTGVGPTVNSQLQVYDALGTAHTVNLTWTQAVDPTTGLPVQGQWSVNVNSPDDSVYGTNGTTATSGDLGTADVTFGGTTTGAVDTTAAPGTPSGISMDGTDPGTVTAPATGTTGAATFSFLATFGGVQQTVTVNLGTYGSSSGTTQYAGTAYSLRGLTQNGVPPGSFSSVTATTNGDIVVNYNNGQTRIVGQVPVITFNAPDALQRQNGQAFTETENSGTALANQAGSGGAGTLVTQSEEASNVDLASELSQLIVAQQAYSANAKVVTTADTLLTTTLNMKQG